MKKQELHRAQLQIKDLEFAKESYLEFKEQAKVCVDLFFFLMWFSVFCVLGCFYCLKFCFCFFF